MLIISIGKGKCDDFRLPCDYIFEAIISFPTRLYPCTRTKGGGHVTRILNNYYHVGDEIDVIMASRPFTLFGAYFCQQSGINSQCGHVAMKMAMWHLDSFIKPPDVLALNAAANRARLRLPPKDRPEGDASETFFFDDIARVCSEYKINFIQVDCKDPNVHPYEVAYQMVESGIPTLLVFTSDSDPRSEVMHAVSVIGHTMNFDEWCPRALDCYPALSTKGLRSRNEGSISSVEWAPHLIIHDDSLGPYLCIDAASFPAPSRSTASRHFPDQSIRWVVGLLGRRPRVNDSPSFIQDLAASYILGVVSSSLPHVKGPWKKRLERNMPTKKSLVLRTQIMEANQYLNELSCVADMNGNPSGLTRANRERLASELPRVFWITEFTLVDLYTTNRSKLGEVLLPLNLRPSFVEVLRQGTRRTRRVPMFRLINYAEVNGRLSVDLGYRSHVRLFRRHQEATDAEF